MGGPKNPTQTKECKQNDELVETVHLRNNDETWSAFPKLVNSS